MGVATGCGFKEIYRFPHTTYPYSSCICTFLQQHPYFFFHFVKMIYIYIVHGTTEGLSALALQSDSNRFECRFALKLFTQSGLRRSTSSGGLKPFLGRNMYVTMCIAT